MNFENMPSEGVSEGLVLDLKKDRADSGMSISGMSGQEVSLENLPENLQSGEVGSRAAESGTSLTNNTFSKGIAIVADGFTDALPKTRMGKYALDAMNQPGEDSNLMDALGTRAR